VSAVKSDRPLVLCFSGHDPGGGAGIQADIESCAAQGTHALSIITAHTVQDTGDVKRVVPVAPILMRDQLETLLEDCEIGSIKIGLLGDAQQIPVILGAIESTRVPVVLDPILRAGGGANLASAALQTALQTELLPAATVLTPNAAEARRLAPGARDLDACASELLRHGAKNVLVTGGDEPASTGDDAVVNSWHAADRSPRRFAWPRLPGEFHGAGCTLAAAIAALLAKGLPMAQALEDSQAYTHRTLQAAVAVGKGRKIPRRLP
jgi:hydroxymethylpyrimidine/phosphomethylpyrimidine kinase